MSPSNLKIWGGCEKNPQGDRIETPKNVAIEILAANLRKLLKEEIPKEADRDLLVITGAIPQWATVTITRVFASRFKNLSIFNPRDGTTIEIPNP
ncbi:hypothetical protein HYZ82_02225 [Candidatus Nomurabacteria bacterium]|nr:hypothetical protein [Candidatus Nomurabacteria bacterium]